MKKREETAGGHVIFFHPIFSQISGQVYSSCKQIPSQISTKAKEDTGKYASTIRDCDNLSEK